MAKPIQKINEDVEIETNIGQGYKTAIDNDSNISSLHEPFTPNLPKTNPPKAKLQKAVTPRQGKTIPILKLDTFASSLEPPVNKEESKLQYVQIPQSQVKVDEETHRDKEVNTLLQKDTFVSSLKEDEPSQKQLIPAPEQQIKYEIATDRDRQAQKLLKQETFVSSLKEQAKDDVSALPVLQLPLPQKEEKEIET